MCANYIDNQAALPKTLNTSLNIFVYATHVSRLRKAYTHTLIPVINISPHIAYIQHRACIYFEFLSYLAIKNRFVLPYTTLNNRSILIHITCQNALAYAYIIYNKEILIIKVINYLNPLLGVLFILVYREFTQYTYFAQALYIHSVCLTYTYLYIPSPLGIIAFSPFKLKQ